MTYDAYGAKAGPATPETDAASHVALASPQKTLRDEFAMAVLPVIFTAAYQPGIAEAGFLDTNDKLAGAAYEIADAMMKARG